MTTKDQFEKNQEWAERQAEVTKGVIADLAEATAVQPGRLRPKALR